MKGRWDSPEGYPEYMRTCRAAISGIVQGLKAEGRLSQDNKPAEIREGQMWAFFGTSPFVYEDHRLVIITETLYDKDDVFVLESKADDDNFVAEMYGREVLEDMLQNLDPAGQWVFVYEPPSVRRSVWERLGVDDET